MGEVVGGVTRDAHAAAIAAQASEDIKRKKEKDLKEKKPVGPGLKLEDMPKAADTSIAINEQNTEVTAGKNVEDAGEANPLDATEAAENILTAMDKQLENIQRGLKDFIAKKIRLAAHNNDPVKHKKLLQSAYNDTKKAYDKIKKVREQLT